MPAFDAAAFAAASAEHAARIFVQATAVAAVGTPPPGAILRVDDHPGEVLARAAGQAWLAARGLSAPVHVVLAGVPARVASGVTCWEVTAGARARPNSRSGSGPRAWSQDDDDALEAALRAVAAPADFAAVAADVVAARLELPWRAAELADLADQWGWAALAQVAAAGWPVLVPATAVLAAAWPRLVADGAPVIALAAADTAGPPPTGVPGAWCWEAPAEGLAWACLRSALLLGGPAWLRVPARWESTIAAPAIPAGPWSAGSALRLAAGDSGTLVATAATLDRARALAAALAARRQSWGVAVAVALAPWPWSLEDEGLVLVDEGEDGPLVVSARSAAVAASPVVDAGAVSVAEFAAALAACRA